MNKKSILWSAIALASLLCVLFSWQFFARAFPILNIDLTMSREAALSAATERASALRLAPSDARSSVRFDTDGQAQNFIELEGGGKEVFIDLLHKDVYQALKWEVRFFREGDAEVTTLYFTPQGKPYGFERHYPESRAGAALAREEARRLAEAAAARDWGIDLTLGRSPYVLVEQAIERRTSGRVDHSFVYERSDQRLGKNGEGRVRLNLAVAGDQLARVRYFMKIPESFQRRFAEMRAANKTIATTASAAMGLLYLLGGCIGGLIVLGRQRFVVSGPAITWAAIIAMLQAAVILDRIPSSWFDYDTAISAGAFLGRQLALAVGAFIGMWLLLALTFTAAESLTRKAFGRHPQLWKLWSPGAGSSWQVLGRTAGGYLWVGFDLAFIVLFYHLTQRYLGWWSPLESLVDPNILATPMPWLAPVANSMQAGFWEECLFRAVPLAGAALLGDFLRDRFHGRLGGRNTWVILALIVQALIFGAAHASYPQQPAYARPVELFLPSILWGMVYLRFGLLPGIVFHFLFDLLLMSLPIFATGAPGLGIDRAIVIAVGLTPLLIVLWNRVRAGRWQTLPAVFTNAAWTRPAAQAVAAENIVARERTETWARTQRLLPVLGLAGLAAWLTLGSFRQDALPLFLDRAQAEKAADAALAQRGVSLTPEWHRFSEVVDISSAQQTWERFVWREGGAAAYASLLGNYLAPPVWWVRYVRLEGDIVERAEEWQVYVENGNDGKAGKQAVAHVRRIHHVLPEARAAKSLSVDDARTLAQQETREHFAMNSETLREVSATENHRPNRNDWNFVFADAKNFLLKSGEARLAIQISGSEVSDTRRYVHVPEDWERAERGRSAMLRVAQIGVGLLAGVLAIGVLIIAIIRGTRGEADKRTFAVVAGAVFVLQLLSTANGWQTVAMTLRTAEPLSNQLWILGASALATMTVNALGIGLFAAVATKSGRQGKFGRTSFAELLLPGIGLAFLLAGAGAALQAISPAQMPHRESVALLSQMSPFLAALLDGLKGGLGLVALSLFLVLLRDFNADFTRRRVLTVCILFLLGFASAFQAIDVTSFLAKGFALGAMATLIYVLAVRHEPKIALIAAAVMAVLAQIRIAIIEPYPDAWLYALCSIAALLLSAMWWAWMIEGKKKSQPSDSETIKAAA